MAKKPTKGKSKEKSPGKANPKQREQANPKQPEKKEESEQAKETVGNSGAGDASAEGAPSIINGEQCPFCNNKTLTLMESNTDVPFFGKTYLFSMNCSSCGYHKADVEAEEAREPCKYTLEIDSEADMKIRVVKSSNATVKIPHVGSIEPGEAANGYITNVEGILQRMKKMIEVVR
ncbi:ZPR1 zinc finger domain-containing protein, partial [Candidatus Woesearchaeota archaeon]|nr:ZPR1 zinc finger domain-containing protein [Candidatus Woesearchaeota archaeon]